MNSKEFRSAMGCFITGVTVVSANDNNRLIGVTANSFSSVSLEPPLVLWSLSKRSRKHPTMTRVKNYAINILANNQKEVAKKFSKSEEPFTGTDFYVSQSGVPIIKNSGAIVTNWKNEPAEKGGNILATSNKNLHKKILKILKGSSK